MSYKALYRIYRPASFDEIAGQKHITQTLKNALKNERVAHAYLFSGPRGTGKTSIAKIFAKAINCEKAPIENPCNECENCLGISNNSISDVIEIDAASNNGVDEIRELRDKVKYLPGYVKYKVYIIDEVHMLSTGAFNALLKTLEEPPQHVIFILCTTEPQKIPATIHSRCQRFDFKSISNADIIDKLFEIAEEEKIEITEEAVKQIANYAEGGLRDAISLLDQVYAYSPKTISVDDVNEICGTVSVVKLIEMVDSIVKKEPAKAIKLLGDLISEGKEIKKITLDLIDFFKNILVYKNLNKLNELSIYDSLEEFKTFAKDLSAISLFAILDILNQTLNEMNWSGQAKTYLELAFLKMTNQESSNVENLMGEIDELKTKISSLENNEVQEPKFKVVQKEMDKQDDKIDLPKVSTENENLNEDQNSETENVEDLVGEDKKQDNLVEEKDEEIEKPTTKEEVKEEMCDDLSKTYDIAFVEEVLNNGDVKDRLYLNDEWQGFERGLVEKDEKYLASLFETGKVVASKKNKIIITFSSTTICNKLMIPDNKEILKARLYDKFERDIDYMALPTHVFTEITAEFKKHYLKGEKDIKLSRIYCKGLEDVSDVKSDKGEREAKIVSDAKDIFGDLVRIKD